MRPPKILKRLCCGPPREVDFDECKLAALLETNRSFADEAALLRHLRRGRPVFMILAEYRLKPEHTFRIAASQPASVDAAADSGC